MQSGTKKHNFLANQALNKIISWWRRRGWTDKKRKWLYHLIVVRGRLSTLHTACGTIWQTTCCVGSAIFNIHNVIVTRIFPNQISNVNITIAFRLKKTHGQLKGYVVYPMVTNIWCSVWCTRIHTTLLYTHACYCKQNFPKPNFKGKHSDCFLFKEYTWTTEGVCSLPYGYKRLM